MKTASETFVPLNDLERALALTQSGQLPVPELMQTLLASQVFVLLDKDPGPGLAWDNTAVPLILRNAAGSPMLAIFTAPERSSTWPSQLPAFAYGLLVSFSWLLKGIASGVGVVVNPGLSIGMEVPAFGVDALRAQSQVPG
jgi:hypothetical protein